jgi:hypothetical protein
MITKPCPINLAYKSPLAISPPPKRGHLSRTGHIGGAYMPVNTVSIAETGLSVSSKKAVIGESDLRDEAWCNGGISLLVCASSGT